jgi:hypothetical protein
VGGTVPVAVAVAVQGSVILSFVGAVFPLMIKPFRRDFDIGGR